MTAAGKRFTGGGLQSLPRCNPCLSLVVSCTTPQHDERIRMYEIHVAFLRAAFTHQWAFAQPNYSHKRQRVIFGCKFPCRSYAGQCRSQCCMTCKGFNSSIKPFKLKVVTHRSWLNCSSVLVSTFQSTGQHTVLTPILVECRSR